MHPDVFSTNKLMYGIFPAICSQRIGFSSLSHMEKLASMNTHSVMPFFLDVTFPNLVFVYITLYCIVGKIFCTIIEEFLSFVWYLSCSYPAICL